MTKDAPHMEAYEWRECHIVNSVTPATQEGAYVTLFEEGAFPPFRDFVLRALKVDTDCPYPDLGKLYMRFKLSGNDDPYDFACSAFDRLVPEYLEEDGGYDDDGNKKEPQPVLRMVTPKLVLPLVRNRGASLSAVLLTKRALGDGATHSVTVTAMGIVKEPVSLKKAQAEMPEPKPHPTLGWCQFCLNHPNNPRKVPAVTRTENNTGVPRCGPCGRWVE